MTRGLRNNNPLNIRRNNTKWQGLSATQTDKSFFQFKTMAYGYRAAFKTLQTYILNKYDTDKDGTANELEDVIMRWAPPCENNTEVYIATVEKAFRHISSYNSEQKQPGTTYCGGGCNELC